MQYSYSLTFDKHVDLVPIFQQWQDLITDPNLDRRFGTELTMHELGVIFSGTFFGTEDEFTASGIPDRIPKGNTSVVIDDWLGVVGNLAEQAALSLSDARTSFLAKSLAFKREDVLSVDTTTKLMKYIDDADRGTLLWFLIFDASGGAVSDIPMNATAYSHRDKIFYCQAYGIGIPELTNSTKDFVTGMVDTIRNSTTATLTTYPGYVDPSLPNGQASYWGPNLDTLTAIKTQWDPNDVFHNPQSVRPASKAA